MKLKTIFSPAVFLILISGHLRSQNCRDTSIYYFISGSKSIVYPLAAKEANIQGDVVVTFDIDSTCSLINRKIASGIGYGCDEEALRALDEAEKSLKSKNGSKCCPVKSIKVPVRFRIK